MATAASYTLTGATGQASIVRGDVSFLSGTWSAGTNTKLKIATGGAKVLAAGVDNNAAATASLIVKWNADEDGSAEDGSIGITACTSGDTGQWWAIVRNT